MEKRCFCQVLSLSAPTLDMDLYSLVTGNSQDTTDISKIAGDSVGALFAQHSDVSKQVISGMKSACRATPSGANVQAAIPKRKNPRLCGPFNPLQNDQS